jgi:integrase-like protein
LQAGQISVEVGKDAEQGGPALALAAVIGAVMGGSVKAKAGPVKLRGDRACADRFRRACRARDGRSGTVCRPPPRHHAAARKRGACVYCAHAEAHGPRAFMGLRGILDGSELGREAWLETSLAKPYSNAGFGNAFKDWCKEAGLPRWNCRGLRKMGAVRAAEAHASEHELMAMFGWEDADMARVYARKAAQKKLAGSGAAKLSFRQRIVPPTVPPLEIINRKQRLREGWWTRQGSNL